MFRHSWIVLAAGVLACSDKAVLRYRPRRDAVHHYVMTMRYAREDAGIVAGSRRSTQVWTIYYTQFGRFTDPRIATRELALRVDSAQLQSNDVAPDLSSMRGQAISAFLDGQGQLLRTERDVSARLTPDLVFRLHAIAAATAPSFSQQPVEAGDRWTMARRAALEDFGTGSDSLAELQLDATLGAIRESANDKVAEVGIQGPLPTRELSVNTSLGPLPARSSGTVIGQYRFSLPRGVMVSQELTDTRLLVTDAPGVGRDTLLSRLVTHTTIRLQ
ncbi:MAG TPA: hypothetical protein VN513_04535 [Gemmatimonadales bacterium]|jgi:hypothetical protein|nr:hypothetical protein [Gemmatimonadales bacterium]